MQPVSRRVNGSLFNENHDILRGAPSAEVDTAWEKLARTDTVLISEAEVLGLGRNPDTRLQVPEHWGECSWYFRSIDS